jgi:hypothetical protein
LRCVRFAPQSRAPAFRETADLPNEKTPRLNVRASISAYSVPAALDTQAAQWAPAREQCQAADFLLSLGRGETTTQRCYAIGVREP